MQESASVGNHDAISRRALIGGVGAVSGAILASSLAPSSATAQTRPGGGITAGLISLAVEGFQIASFSELSELTVEVEPEENQDTSSSAILKKVPGRPKFPSVTLKRGITHGVELWAWHEAARQGNLSTARRNATLVMYDSAGEAVLKYALVNAWPSKLRGGPVAAGGTDAVTETVTLSMEHLLRVLP